MYLYVYVYVCLCVCVYVCMYVCLSVCVCARFNVMKWNVMTCTCMCMRMRMCMCRCVDIYIYNYIYTGGSKNRGTKSSVSKGFSGFSIVTIHFGLPRFCSSSPNHVRSRTSRCSNCGLNMLKTSINII